ncbi:hypothetical protein [Aliarcobacter butzleri]|uniref:hypothetical protein n=1 Tax=Aliarcobacter butzleri TaxID=28197 RepID=UPI003AF3C2FE
MNIIKELFQRRMLVSKIYKSGIGKAYILLRVILPIVLLSIILIIFYFLQLNLNDFKELIKQINSLLGIILGFSIASLAIFISINNKKLDDLSKTDKYTYRQIGSSLFFYNVELSLFISLLGIFILYIDIPVPNISICFTNLEFIKDNFFKLIALKLFMVLIYFFCFFQLILNLFFSSLFLNSSIK